MCYVVAIPRKPDPGAGLLRRSDLRRISRKRRLVFVNHVRQLKPQRGTKRHKRHKRHETLTEVRIEIPTLTFLPPLCFLGLLWL